jgi:hypothetical protein
MKKAKKEKKRKKDISDERKSNSNYLDENKYPN